MIPLAVATTQRAIHFRHALDRAGARATASRGAHKGAIARSDVEQRPSGDDRQPGLGAGRSDRSGESGRVVGLAAIAGTDAAGGAGIGHAGASIRRVTANGT